MGFKDEAISAALRWLDGLKAAAIVDLPNGHRALRVYLAREQQKLGHEGLGFIAFLEAADLITPALRELVIERSMMLDDDPVPLAKFKIIVLMVLWSHQQDLEPLVVEELLDAGNSRLLH